MRTSTSSGDAPAKHKLGKGLEALLDGASASAHSPPSPANADAVEMEARVSPQEVERFEQIAAHLTALHDEFAVQAKAKPDNPINLFKLRMVNEKLVAANELLAGEHRPFEGFELFEAADLPSNSDVALVLGAYLASLERWRSARVHYENGSPVWRTNNGSKIAAARPTRFVPSEK